MATTTHSARQRQCTLHGDGNALSHSTTMEFLCSEEPLQVDFAYNCFTDSRGMGFNEISFNFSSCESLIWKIPKHLGNFTSLRYLMLEANQFSGAVPPELGKLINLETFMKSRLRTEENGEIEKQKKRE
ncbi:probable LRR receptor-like serine/threonine-protein kinase RFK1 [Phaseolus vulgaris]|uniref:probable LRR receptor-like serine/threonine-protein kinase RFK1 n=1 Tax=Phaseolus vulgaris TaxID=3885 RepID=UPI0035CA0E2B